MNARTLLAFCLSGAIATAATAQLPRIILQGSGDPQVFTDVSDALAAAQPNDKLYFSGGTFLAAPGLVIDKPLHFVGAGIHPDSSSSTGTTMWATDGSTNITITTNASGSTFTGIILNPGGDIQYGTSIADDDPKGLIFQRCDLMDPISSVRLRIEQNQLVQRGGC